MRCLRFTPKLDYHLYTNPIPDTFSPSHFMSDKLREELQRRSDMIHTVPTTPYNLPEELQGYHSLVPLEPLVPDRRKLINWHSAVYRATNSSDGTTYVLRRIESVLFSPWANCKFYSWADFRLTHRAAFGAIESWSRIRHPNIVPVREAFTTRAFNDNCLFEP